MYTEMAAVDFDRSSAFKSKVSKAWNSTTASASVCKHAR